MARRVAETLGVTYLDTGAMYRALAWAALEQGMATDDEVALVELFDRSDLQLAPDGSVSWDGTDITAAIRRVEVTRAVSTVAALPAVRERPVGGSRGMARLVHLPPRLGS